MVGDYDIYPHPKYVHSLHYPLTNNSELADLAFYDDEPFKHMHSISFNVKSQCRILLVRFPNHLPEFSHRRATNRSSRNNFKIAPYNYRIFVKLAIILVE